jgi:hypothetical protein
VSDARRHSQRLTRRVFAALFACVALAFASAVREGTAAETAASTKQTSDTNAASQQDPPQTARSCRMGAFLEADRILGSVVNISRLLPPDTPEGARAELDSILYTALQMARSELHCVNGVLTHGFDRSFAETTRRAVGLAKARNLSKDVVTLGEEVIAQLEATATSPKRRLPVTSRPTAVEIAKP